MVKILFLDQSGKPGGAELCLLDIAKPHGDRCLVALFADGSFKTLLQQYAIPVQILTDQAIQVRKDSGLLQGFFSLWQLVPLIKRVSQLSYDYDLIYANTQKALVIGAIASLLSHRPLIYHLHDILSADHFSTTNRRLIISLANRCAALVIANSQASQAAFVAEGGRSDLVQVVYNGFELEPYRHLDADRQQIREQLGLKDRFVIGHFSRLSPWKGQHVLIEALRYCPPEVIAILVGDALFGEQDYVIQLHRQIAELDLKDRVRFLGFRSDIPQLMAACDLVAHTSTAPEPFGRVIVEAMLCKRPVIAAAAGGAIELVNHNVTGWLCPPSQPQELASLITDCYKQPEEIGAIARQAQIEATQRFHIDITNRQIADLLDQVMQQPTGIR